MTADPRCLSSCEVVRGSLKRCIRSTGHTEDHIWVESDAVVGGQAVIARWTGSDAARPNVLGAIKVIART